MSRRDYPVADLYEERERDFYGSGRRGTREYVDFEEDVRTTRGPDFLREDYGRSAAAGPLVVRGQAHAADRRTEVDVESRYARSARGSPPRPRTREIEKEEIIIREDRGPARRREHSVDFSARRSVPDLRSRPRDKEEIDIEIRRDSDARSVRTVRPREVEREEIDIDIRRRDDDTRSVRSRRPREAEKEEIDIDIRHGDARSVRSSRPRDVERDEVTIRRSETARPAPRGESEEITIRRGEGTRPPPSLRPRDVERTEIDIKEDRRGGRSRRDVESEEIDITRESRGRGYSPTRERITIREQSRGPPPRERSMPAPNLVRRETEEFVIRRRRPPSPSPSPSPSPPPPPMRESRQEIIIRRTEQRSPTPPPPPPPEPEPLPPPPVLAPITRPPIYQEIHQEIITHHRHIDHGVERVRSPTPPPMREPTPPPPPPPPPQEAFESLEIDIRRGGGRGRDEEIDIIQTRDNRRDFSEPPPVRQRPSDMWTEITKDLVLKEAVDHMGYEYEETDDFFYVMEYLKYDDVLQLVEISDDIRKARRRRIREIEWERELAENAARPREERYYDREIIIDKRERRY